MSHWTRGKTKITDLGLLRKVAEKMGCQIKEQKSMTSHYAGSVNCEFVIQKDGGQAAVVKGKENYFIQMDNWGNRLTDTIGQDGATLTRDYMTELVKSRIDGTLLSETVSADGYVELEIHVHA